MIFPVGLYNNLITSENCIINLASFLPFLTVQCDLPHSNWFREAKLIIGSSVTYLEVSSALENRLNGCV